MLIEREFRKMRRVLGQAILTPLVSSVLFFVAFGFGLGPQVQSVEGQPYFVYIVTGLVFQALVNDAFLPNVGMLWMMKTQRTIGDILAAPLSGLELLIAFATIGMIRGLLMGVLTWMVASLFTGMHLAHPWVALGFAALATYVFALFGVLAALIADRFEHINRFGTLLLAPLLMFGGVYFSVQRLPEPWRSISLANPIVYMVEGLRYGITSVSIFPPAYGAVLLLTLAAIATALLYRLLDMGYKLRR